MQPERWMMMNKVLCECGQAPKGMMIRVMMWRRRGEKERRMNRVNQKLKGGRGLKKDPTHSHKLINLFLFFSLSVCDCGCGCEHMRAL